MAMTKAEKAELEAAKKEAHQWRALASQWRDEFHSLMDKVVMSAAATVEDEPSEADG